MQTLPTGTSGGVRRDIDVLIVNYKTSDLTTEAVESVLSEAEAASVIIVDNASGDGSVERLTKRFKASEQVRVVRSERNAGFGAGNNLAASFADAPYIFLLNSDAVVAPGCLGLLRATLESESGVGLVAPAVYSPEGAGLQDGAFGTFPTAGAILTRRTTFAHPTLAPDWISGVAFMTRRADFVRIGGFDEAYFMYYEDVDLCRRYRAAGLSALRETRARVVHRLGASESCNDRRLAAYDAGQDRYLRLSGASPVTRAGVRLVRGIYRRISSRNRSR